MMLMVGCPVLRREWIVHHWVDRVEKACAVADLTPNYVFVCDRRDPTRGRLAHLLQNRHVTFVDVVDDVRENQPQHSWGVPGKLERMVDVRNLLLEEVRRHAPDAFLSLDSDILVHPDSIANLAETLTGPEKFAAVGGKLFLAPGLGCCSAADYSPTKGLLRRNYDWVAEVGVIMAMKLMSHAAYNVDYEYERNGEDVGWSLACTRKGLRLGFDGRVTNKHVRDRAGDNGEDLITKPDWRCGY